MTFIKKLLDILNMNNWEKKAIVSSSTSNFPTVQSFHNSYEAILTFWRKHPQIYQNDFTNKESTQKEYLLYGKTLILWGYDKARPLLKSFPYYFTSECNISDPLKLQTILIKQGYLTIAPAKSVLFSYTVAKLKIIADSIGCSKKGKKSELVDRIYSSLDDSALETISLQSNLYILSDKGNNFIHDNYDYVELHRHWKYRISLYEYNRNRFYGNKRRSFNDAAYVILTERIYKKTALFNYYFLDQDYMSLYDITFSEGRYDIAIEYYLQYLYLKSCCYHEMIYFQPGIHISKDSVSHIIIFTVYDAPRVLDLKDYYNPALVDNIYSQPNQPPSFMEINIFKHMIEEMFTEVIFDYEKYNSLIRKELEKYAAIL